MLKMSIVDKKESLDIRNNIGAKKFIFKIIFYIFDNYIDFPRICGLNDLY